MLLIFFLQYSVIRYYGTRTIASSLPASFRSRWLYFKQHSNDKLCDPQGPLLIEVPSTSIISVNKEVRHVVSKEPAKSGPYAKFTAEQRAEIGMQAGEYGIVAAIRYYSKKYPDLKESRVHTWKNAYTSEIKKRRRQGHEDISVKKLPERKRGRLFLLGEELEM